MGQFVSVLTFSPATMSVLMKEQNIKKKNSDVTESPKQNSTCSYKNTSLADEHYPCRCELTDSCFGMLREALSQFNVKATVHHTNLS